MSEARHTPLETARLTVSAGFVMRGSIVAGTAEHQLDQIETALVIESGAETAAVASLVTQAERMCFVLDALQRPHAVARTVTLNGQLLALDG